MKTKEEMASSSLPEGTTVLLLSAWTQWWRIRRSADTRERTQEERRRRLQHITWCARTKSKKTKYPLPQESAAHWLVCMKSKRSKYPPRSHG